MITVAAELKNRPCSKGIATFLGFNETNVPEIEKPSLLQRDCDGWH